MIHSVINLLIVAIITSVESRVANTSLYTAHEKYN
jgi:hypothetical protein